ncbi:hypothetical protein [Curtobacterium sp. RRHDQ10]|uniref:hypothetical protein n=1 Tax=Curtobacterium phyllosphaerae TaxID=3413379 RepID=UPI003BF29308
MSNLHNLAELRQDPIEWRRRGLIPPAALEAMVNERVGAVAHVPAEPSYADFFAVA